MAIVKFDRGLYKTGKKTARPGYGQIEPNQVWFNRAGMVEAQCFLDPEQFSDVQVGPLTKFVAADPGNPGATPPVPATEAVKIVAQNGAFLMVDKANKNLIIPDTANSELGFPMGINYSSEQMYDERLRGRRNFFLTTKDWLPRIGYTEVGMRINTNTVQWDNTFTVTDTVTGETLDLTQFSTTADSYDMYQALKTYFDAGAKAPVYACVVNGSDGELVIGADPDDALGNVYAQLVKIWDNADRTCSFMFQIINKPTA